MDIDDLKRRAGITEATEMNYFGTTTDQIIQRMTAEMDRLQQSLEKQQEVSYQEIGSGGREYDQNVVSNIRKLERQIEGYDLAIDALQKSMAPESPKNW